MTQRRAACACGQLAIVLSGDPAMVSSCSCQQCQRRTGALFGVTCFYPREQVVAHDGEAKTWRRVAESERTLDFHFCPTCGSTVWWEPERVPGAVCVAGGAFADPSYPPPRRMVWTEFKHPFVALPDDLPTYRQNT